MLRAYSATDVLIDSFVTSQSTPGGIDARNVADGSGILGGERDFVSYLSLSANGNVPGQLRVAFPSGVQSVRAGATIIYDGNDNNASSGSFSGLGSVDLTGGGINDRFRFDITSVTGSSATLSIELMSPNKGSRLQVNLPQIAGVFDVPFGTFQHDTFFSAPANFNSVGFISFHISMASGESVVINDITTSVPEPSTISLMLVAGLGLGLFTRTSRR